MKLTTFVSETPTKKMKMIITESQLRNLATQIIQAQEEGTIKRTHLVKSNFYEKK